ncbi:MAG: nuclear transport factor 2 family protein [Acidobacteriota bacterium]
MRSAVLFTWLASGLLPGAEVVAQEPSGSAWHMEIRNVYGAEGFAAIYTFDPGLIAARLDSSEVGHPSYDVGRRTLTPAEDEIVGNAIGALAGADLKMNYHNPYVSDGYRVQVDLVAPDGRKKWLDVANMEVPELNALIVAVAPLLPPTSTGRPGLYPYKRYIMAIDPNPAPVATKELFDELAEKDRLLYETVFNTCDLQALRSLVTDDFEMFHDKSGLVAKTGRQFVQNIRGLCDRRTWGYDYPARRELVEGTLEVFPLDNYGAIQVGVHRFYREGGITPVEVSRFTNIWKRDADGTWKLARALSYDHKPAR